MKNHVQGPISEEPYWVRRPGKEKETHMLKVPPQFVKKNYSKSYMFSLTCLVSVFSHVDPGKKGWTTGEKGERHLSGAGVTSRDMTGAMAPHPKDWKNQRAVDSPICVVGA